MKRHYENFYNEKQVVTTLSGVDQTERCEFAKESFKPMVYNTSLLSNSCLLITDLPLTFVPVLHQNVPRRSNKTRNVLRLHKLPIAIPAHRPL